MDKAEKNILWNNTASGRSMTRGAMFICYPNLKYWPRGISSNSFLLFLPPLSAVGHCLRKMVLEESEEDNVWLAGWYGWEIFRVMNSWKACNSNRIVLIPLQPPLYHCYHSVTIMTRKLLENAGENGAKDTIAIHKYGQKVRVYILEECNFVSKFICIS